MQLCHCRVYFSYISLQNDRSRLAAEAVHLLTAGQVFAPKACPGRLQSFWYRPVELTPNCWPHATHRCDVYNIPESTSYALKMLTVKLGWWLIFPLHRIIVFLSLAATAASWLQQCQWLRVLRLSLVFLNRSELVSIPTILLLSSGEIVVARVNHEILLY